jgi:pimeloyl-ACP methyl ester carboxylesterase
MNWISTRRSRAGKRALLLVTLRSAFAVLDPVAPGLAARLALRLFLTPTGRPRIAPEERDCMSRATPIAIPALPGIAVWSWGQGPVVLLVHGWGGRGSQMCAFVAPLLEAGFKVVSFDGPAHGQSYGVRTDMIAFTDVINRVIAYLDGVEALIGHSFGAACALLALRQQQRLPKKVALIGCPPNGIWVTEQFGAVLRIAPRTLARMRSLLEARHPGVLKWSDLSTEKLALTSGLPMLLVHDKDDRTIPYAEAALHFGSGAPHIEHLATEGLGHRRVLKAAAVIERTLQFLAHPQIRPGSEATERAKLMAVRVPHINQLEL